MRYSKVLQREASAEEISGILMTGQVEVKTLINQLEALTSARRAKPFIEQIEVTFKSQRSLIEDLRLQCNFETAHVRKNMLPQADAFDSELSKLTKEAYAIIFSMDCKPIEASEQERINLFAGASSKTLNENTLEVTLKQEIDATERMRHSKRLMEDLLNQSAAGAELLALQSKRLQAIRDKNKTYGTTLKSGTGLLTKIKHHTTVDRIIFSFLFLVFLFMCGYVLFKNFFGNS